MRRVPLLLLCLCLPAIVAGCGGADEERSVTPTENAVAAAAQKSSAQESARVTMTGRVEVAGQQGTYTGGGVLDFKPPRAKLGLDMQMAGQSFHLDEVLEGATIYMKLPESASGALPDGKTWTKVDLDEALDSDVSGAISAGMDPGQYLRLLAASGGVREVGEQSVGGRRTTHYTATIDYRELAESGPEALRDVARLSLKFSATPTTPVDVWIDEQGLIRRQKLRIETKAVGPSPAQKQQLQIDLPEYGVDTAGIVAPRESDTYDATDTAKSALDDAEG